MDNELLWRGALGLGAQDRASYVHTYAWLRTVRNWPTPKSGATNMRRYSSWKWAVGGAFRGLVNKGEEPPSHVAFANPSGLIWSSWPKQCLLLGSTRLAISVGA